MTLSFAEVTVLKGEISEKFGLYLHFHDACAGQYFSFDEDIGEDVKDHIIGYFKNADVKFSSDGRSFSVK